MEEEEHSESRCGGGILLIYLANASRVEFIALILAGTGCPRLGDLPPMAALIVCLSSFRCRSTSVAYPQLCFFDGRTHGRRRRRAGSE